MAIMQKTEIVNQNNLANSVFCQPAALLDMITVATTWRNLCHHCGNIVALLVAVAAAQATASEINGRVVGVADGDTLTVLQTQTTVRIRLAEIDAPEKAQPFGQRSKQSLSDLCYGKDARVVISNQDRYGRSIGRVWCTGIDANAEQVRRGLAWVYDHYVTDESLYALQDAARKARSGLWADPAPIRPWEWRKQKRNSKINPSPY